MSDDKPFSVRVGIVPERAMQTKRLDAETLLRIVRLVLERARFSSDAEFWVANGFFTHRFDGGHICLFRSSFECRLPCSSPPRKGEPFGRQFIPKVLDFLAVNGPWWVVFELIEFVWDMDNAPWDIIEWVPSREEAIFLCEPFTQKDSKNSFASSLQGILEWMNVGYRFMPSTGKFVNVHSDEEAEEIDKACSGTSGHFAEARTHMKNAVADFWNSETDNANTVKEALSAAESIVKELTEKKFKPGLRQLEKDGILPPPSTVREKGGSPVEVNHFVKALEEYWGYANPTSRHGRGKGDEPPDRDTARFLLVTCAAFVNYITARWLAKGKSS